MNSDIDEAIKIITDSGLRPGANMTNEFKELLADLSKRDGISPQKIVAGKVINDIIDNQRTSGPDKLKKIKQRFLEMRFPEFVKANNRFKEALKALKLSPKVRITPEPFFEDNKLRVEFSYRHPSELPEIIASLERLAKVDVVNNALEDTQDNS